MERQRLVQVSAALTAAASAMRGKLVSGAVWPGHALHTCPRIAHDPLLQLTAAVKLTHSPSDAWAAAVQTLVFWQLVWQRLRPVSTTSGTPWTGWLTSERALCCDTGRQRSQAPTAVPGLGQPRDKWVGGTPAHVYMRKASCKARYTSSRPGNRTGQTTLVQGGGWGPAAAAACSAS